MKIWKQLSLFFALCLTVILISSQHTSTMEPTPAEVKIEWMSWEEAIERMATEPKKIFVDVYTDWCGWCKRMDASTFVDPEVVAIMNEHFYAVKLDAEQRADIQYDNHTFVYRANAGRRGVHELAAALLDNRMSYPSFVYLDEAQKRISISPGYKDAKMMEVELRFIGADHFKTTSFQDFQNQQGG